MRRVPLRDGKEIVAGRWDGPNRTRLTRGLDLDPRLGLLRSIEILLRSTEYLAISVFNFKDPDFGWVPVLYIQNSQLYNLNLSPPQS